MDVFALRDQVTADYARYMRSFIEIRDARVSARVEEQLPRLWPDPLIQLNPAFEPGATFDELIADGLLHPDCREIFAIGTRGARRPLQLHHHQVEGIRAARADQNYVLTTGTGSGKSLSYIVPIVDHVLRTPKNERRGIQAIVVYPMNALANSQVGELEKYLGTGPDRPVSFCSYTGQDDEQTKRRIAADPPDILLTNYVMLELILTRTNERQLIQAARDLRFLVFDELHTYRGRQGADVALLCRRVREACRAPRLIHVGTSATLASDGSWEQQRAGVAEVASTIFGASVSARRVIGESLRRITPELDFEDPDEVARLRARVASSVPERTEDFVSDPLTAWIESTLGLKLHDGRLVRQQPKTIVAAGQALAKLVGQPAERCQTAIRDALMAGPRHTVADRPVFAFRLHQFISKGDTVYASLAPPETRFLTTQPQRFVPESNRQQILLPLCFCRECGQDFYTVRRRVDKAGSVSYVARDVGDQSDQTQTDEESASEAGFLYISTERPWPRDIDAVIQMVPESWLEDRRGKWAIRRERKDRLPSPITVSPDGLEGHGELEAAYFRAPFLFCPNCRVTYDARQQADFGKVGTLGSEGRSTATTVLSLSTLRKLGALPENARKLLSFTDNRQDAALQAGHFNDFVSLGLVRTGLYQALASRAESAASPTIDHDQLTQAVFEALALPLPLYAVNPDVVLGQLERTQAALRRVLGYFLYRDLARGWRLTSPNLEQCGLLNIGYRDLALFCEDDGYWTASRDELSKGTPDRRREICTTLLNYLRRELVIHVDYLDPAKQEQIQADAGQLLIDPWRIGDGERLEQSYVALLGASGKRRGKSFAGGRFVYLSPRGGFGQYLRRKLGYPKLSSEDLQELINHIVAALRKLGVLHVVEVGGRGEQTTGYQLSAAAMLWSRGDALRAAHDLIRVPQAPEGGLRTNEFFRSFYRSDARDLARYQAHEHTAQVRAEVREQREQDFRAAKLPLLFCSPTMELGVDISELNIVNMRNVPPTPANYAQRSGRAGRGGQPAFVFTYCTSQSPHDQYFFAKPERMVAGEVRTPCIDLDNEDLLRSHVHSIWLAEADLSLGSSLAELLDISGEKPPVTPKSEVLAKLHDRAARTRARVRVEAALGTELLAMHGQDREAAERWLDDTLDAIPRSFERACDRWRSLFLAADTQAKQQQKIIEDRSRPAAERDVARGLRREAESQLELLVDHREGIHSTFYPYRYFASEGFLPGYNFPRLPLSAYLDNRARRNRDPDEFLSRPRFLAVSEFGPRSIIYHEGARYVTNKVILGADLELRDGTEGLLERAVRCDQCGAIEPLLAATAPDLCHECHATLGSPTINFFRMRNVSALRRDRITSDEEERLRMGYDLRTAVHFPTVDGRPRRYAAALVDSHGAALANLTYGHGADVWRINMGWRRRKQTEPPGFQLDIERGIWVRSQNPEEPDADGEQPSSPRQERVIPFVKDTRNCLLIKPEPPLSNDAMASLQAALKTSIQLEFQLEDRELAAEPLPSRAKRDRLLIYEAAEGGAGVLRRLLDMPDAVRRVAERALELCHFDVHGHDLGRPAPDRDLCEAACYDCLLSYFNQPDHELVDRHLLRDILLRWRDGHIERSSSAELREDHLDGLLASCESELERRWLRFLAERGHNLPTRAQVHLPAANTRVDFLYEPDQGSPVPVFIDGPPHDGPDVAHRDQSITEQLEDLGYLVLRFHHRADWSEIIARHPGLFGVGTPQAPTPPSAPTPAQPPTDELAELLVLFEPEWRAAIRELAAYPELRVDGGGELGGARVTTGYLARIDHADAILYLIDANEPDADRSLHVLQARGDRALALRPDHPNLLTAVLSALRA
jgi:ATP-dependent helicase YprA (DUF1998 family)